MEGTADAKTQRYEEHDLLGATPGSLFWLQGKENVGGGGWRQRRGQARRGLVVGHGVWASLSGTSLS